MAPIPVLDRVEDTVRRRSTDLVALSHAIHAEPELAFAEPQLRQDADIGGRAGF